MNTARAWLHRADFLIHFFIIIIILILSLIASRAFAFFPLKIFVACKWNGADLSGWLYVLGLLKNKLVNYGAPERWLLRG